MKSNKKYKSASKNLPQKRIPTAKVLPLSISLLKDMAEKSNTYETENRMNNLKEEIEKVEEMMKNNAFHRKQSYKSRIVVLSKLKMGLNQGKDKGPENNASSKDSQENMLQNISNFLEYKIREINKNQAKVIKDQANRQSLMIQGLEQYEANERKNLVKNILQKAKLRLKQSQHENNLSKSYLIPVSDRSEEKDQDQQQLREITNEDYNKLQQIMDYHVAQKQKINNFISLPLSPTRKKQKLRKNQTELITKTFENDLKSGASSRKCQFISKMNNLCLQVKNKETKLNKYFWEMGENSSQKNICFLKENMKKQERKTHKPTFCNKNVKRQRKTAKSKESASIPQQKCNSTIPRTFLNTLKQFYVDENKFMRKTLSKDRRKRQVYSSNIDTQKVCNEFGEQNLNIFYNNSHLKMIDSPNIKFQEGNASNEKPQVSNIYGGTLKSSNVGRNRMLKNFSDRLYSQTIQFF